VIAEMVSDGFVTNDQANEMLAEKINIIDNEPNIEAPHFVFYIKDVLKNEFGFSNIDVRGLTITTSLDLNIQKSVDEITKEEVEKAKGLGFSNGAALVTNPKTGEVLAMAGSKDYWAEDIDGKYNVTTAERQPGSSIKPINYLLAFEKGKTLMTPIVDGPVTYNVPGQKPYTPRDYTGSYLGTVTLETALASSLNIPSVKLLSEDGINNMIDLAQKMGITTWDNRSRFGLSLALGAGEVKMTDMAEAYGTFANLGYRVPLNPVAKIENYLGETIYVNEPEQIAVAPAEDTFLIDTALSSNEARTPIFGANSKLVIPGKTVAVKTGTTNNLKDNWCIGWTPSVLVATWVGNNDATPMSWVASGVSGATPIWNRIMNGLLKSKPDEQWQPPANIEKASVCGKDGYFIKGTEKNVVCVLPSPTPTPAN
jgi:membrane peptidoglycan carboxypeptidase